MARIRSIKPSFFRSEDVSVLPLRARLTWIGLWTHCDDAGRTKDNARLIKGDIWPLDDVSLRDIEDDLATLAAHGRIVRYEVDGRRYLEIANWRDHQAIQKPTPSKLPPPPDTTTGQLPEDSGSPTARKGREGKGGEGTRVPAREPPTRCTEHADTPDPPPCGRCADARRAHDTAQRQHAAWAAAERQADAHQHAETTRQAIAACRLCDSSGYAGPYLCTHDPTVPDRAHRGAAAASAAIRQPTTDPEGHCP